MRRTVGSAILALVAINQAFNVVFSPWERRMGLSIDGLQRCVPTAGRKSVCRHNRLCSAEITAEVRQHRKAIPYSSNTVDNLGCLLACSDCTLKT